jgi:hypothetical protein
MRTPAKATALYSADCANTVESGPLLANLPACGAHITLLAALWKGDA